VHNTLSYTYVHLFVLISYLTAQCNVMYHLKLYQYVTATVNVYNRNNEHNVERKNTVHSSQNNCK